MPGVITFPSPDFTAASRREGPRSVVRLRGELDCANEGLARAEIEIALDRGGTELVVDLRELTFIDARGVHVLLDARAACSARQRRLLVIPAPEHVQRIIAFCCGDGGFELIEPDHRAARSAA
jgi:anti-anti-sigma factor